MLDIKFIREHPELVKKGAVAKNFTAEVDELLSLDEVIRPLKTQWQDLQAERNKLSKEIGKTPPAEREALKAKVQQIKERMDGISTDLAGKEATFAEIMLRIPQPAREDVPIGKDDQFNVEVKTWGQKPAFDFKPKDHVDLGEALDIIDFKRGVKLAGSRSFILKGDGAQLENALMRFAYDFLLERKYTPLHVPVLVSEECMEGTGYFPTGREQAYFVEKDALALVGTAEVSLTSYLSHEMLAEKDLPQRFMAQSTCFRREAGTYGKDTRGLYRVHQFQKIEQVIIAPNDAQASEELHQELLTNAEDILQALGLSYRVVYVCTGDLGQGQLRKHDIETWMPSREGYGETHSCSTFHEFQSRRLKMRYKAADGKKLFCHTLNNTALATPRMLIPLLESYQEKDGRIRIPDVLRPYMGNRTHIG